MFNNPESDGNKKFYFSGDKLNKPIPVTVFGGP
jgi:hypothetical protein